MSIFKKLKDIVYEELGIGLVSTENIDSIGQNYRFCKRCYKGYDVSPFASMLQNGESADSVIQVYGERYNLCPSCTFKLYKFLKMQ